MGLKPNFVNPNYWEFLADHREGPAPYEDAYNQELHVPVNAFNFPSIATHSTLAITITTDNIKDNWKFGGSCGMLVKSGLEVGGLYNSHVGNWVKLWLHKINLVIFPDLVNDYAIRFYPPKWFKNYYVVIYEYIGTGNPDLEGKADAIYTAITTP